MTVAAGVVGALLGLFTVRRLVFWLASLLPARPVPASRTRSVAVLVPARNEAARLPRLLAALDACDYPPALMSVVVFSDGSIDETPHLAAEWAAGRAAGRSRALAIASPVSQGKGAALRVALAAAPGAELVVVLDADTVPAPDALARLAGAFDDPAVGAACGYPDPGRRHRSMAARYAALERWVSHRVTFAAKDRLGLRPPVIGAVFAVRAAALADIGGFPCGAMAEDIDLSLALTRAGWKTRWLGEAVAREDVPPFLAGFRLQRLRWSRGLMTSAPRTRTLEDALAATGYLDRLAFVAGAALALAGDLPAWLPIAYAALPLAIILTALWRAGVPGKLAYLAAVPPMALFDIWVTAESVLAQLGGGQMPWREQARRDAEPV
jgi:cellulose synthase/poly-beta-1,6-N-acetylglucosamine synthase-like glycosyltransferase